MWALSLGHSFGLEHLITLPPALTSVNLLVSEQRSPRHPPIGEGAVPQPPAACPGPRTLCPPQLPGLGANPEPRLSRRSLLGAQRKAGPEPAVARG